jgi:uncharacterized protein involved in outer membrane biogenesis
LVFEGLSIGNPPGFPGDKPLGTIRRLRLRVAARPLIASAGRDIVVSEITVEDPQGDLRAAPDGSRNWAFSSSSGGSARSVRIGTLTITDGTFRINDPKLKADLVLKLHTQSPRNGGEPNLLVHSQGIYAGQPFTGDFTGGSILSLRDPAKPYPVDLVAIDGTTHIALKGTLLDAAQLKGANLQLELKGQDLAHLYPILGLPLVETPPFALRGHLDYGGNHIKFSDFAGTVGHSDLEGDFDVDRGYRRPLITAELSSHSVVLRELGGFLGTTPEATSTPNEAPEHRS